MIIYDVSKKELSFSADCHAGLTPNEEEAMLQKNQTPEERLESVEQRTDALESTTDDMILLMADLIGGN